LIRKHQVDLVAFSYSDVPHLEVMHQASRVMAEGADFILLAATYTMPKASKPVISVCEVRTGCGKSQTTRKVCEIIPEEADVIVWDGGNNDTPFFHPDIHIVLFDPHRAGHELLYYPGETNLRMADIAIINKADSAPHKT
jgi:predicted GTPase